MIRVLDLFSGIGGFSLGLKRAGGFRTVCYVEIEAYCQEVLLRRMQEGRLDAAPVFGDITEFPGGDWRGAVDLITGGFPCQDLSVAGKREGIDGARSGLWGEFARVIGEVRPRIVLVENVPGLLTRGMGRVLGDLAEIGYDAEWDCIPAAAVGAPHQRDRVWIVAYSNAGGLSGQSIRKKQPRGSQSVGTSEIREECEVADAKEQREELREAARERQGRSASGGAEVADTEELTERPGLRKGQQGGKRDGRPGDGGGSETMADANCGERPFGRIFERMGRKQELDSAASGEWWATEPNVGRVAHGIPSRVDRLKGLGNAIVPQVVEWIGVRIREALNGQKETRE